MSLLCFECHAWSGCVHAAKNRNEMQIEPQSRGRCEDCKLQALCSDCHGYKQNGFKARQEARQEAKETREAE